MRIPAQPAAGAPPPVGPLVTPADYQSVTHDAEGVDQATLDEAVLLVEQACTRTFAYGTYAERLYVNRDGFVFPTATPLDPAAPIVPMVNGYIQGAGVWVGWSFPPTDLPVFTGALPPQCDLTYSGGYQSWANTGGPTERLHPKLRRIFCRVTWFLAHPVVLAGMPGGVKSTSSAGVSVTGDLSSFVTADPDLARDIASFTRRDTRSW